MMAERPILFSTAMVRALLREDGPKTMTRRVIKPQPVDVMQCAHVPGQWSAAHDRELHEGLAPRCLCTALKPFCGDIGDRLWVREAWSAPREYHHRSPSQLSKTLRSRIHYAADGQKPDWAGRSRASIHMPRWASRTTLVITEVRVERVAAITEADARREGVGSVAEFRALWDEINGSRPGCSWADRPWVWVLGFHRVDQPAAGGR